MFITEFVRALFLDFEADARGFCAGCRVVISYLNRILVLKYDKCVAGYIPKRVFSLLFPYVWNTNPHESKRIACLYTAPFPAYRGEPRHADALAVGSGGIGDILL